MSFSFPPTLSCSLAFLVLVPWRASVTFILFFPSTGRALKLTRIFLFDMSDSTSQIPENDQVFTRLSTLWPLCLSENLIENYPPKSRKIHLFFAKNSPKKHNWCWGYVSNWQTISLYEGECSDWLEITVKGRQFNANHRH